MYTLIFVVLQAFVIKSEGKWLLCRLRFKSINQRCLLRTKMLQRFFKMHLKSKHSETEEAFQNDIYTLVLPTAPASQAYTIFICYWIWHMISQDTCVEYWFLRASLEKRSESMDDKSRPAVLRDQFKRNWDNSGTSCQPRNAASFL